MNIVVLAKSAVDEVELRSDQEGHPVLKGATTKLSNFDLNGLEEAIHTKEVEGGTVAVLTLGGPESKKALKEAMAMGGTRGVHIVTDTSDAPDSLGTAYCLAKAIKKTGGVDVVFCSEGASDTYQGQVGAMVAEFLGWPMLPNAKNVKVDGELIRCEQEVEGGVNILEASLPAVVSVVSGANKPRYPTLIQVVVAGRKPIEDVPIASLIDQDYPATSTRVLGVVLEPLDRKKVVFEGSPEETAAKLVQALRGEGVL